jgi:hypothetical protein
MSGEVPREEEMERVGITGWVEIIVKDKHGRIKYCFPEDEHGGAKYRWPEDKYGGTRYRYPEAKAGEEPKEEKSGGEGPKEEKSSEGDDPPIFSSFPAKMPEFYYRKNVVTDAGIGAVVRLVFAGLTEDKFGYLAIGTGTTPESPSDTALQSELKRKAASVTQMTTAITGDTAKLEAEFSSADGLTGTATISESGIFNAATGGILLARKTFPGIPLDFSAGDSILIRYFVQMIRS